MTLTLIGSKNLDLDVCEFFDNIYWPCGTRGAQQWKRLKVYTYLGFFSERSKPRVEFLHVPPVMFYI